MKRKPIEQMTLKEICDEVDKESKRIGKVLDSKRDKTGELQITKAEFDKLFEYSDDLQIQGNKLSGWST